MSSEFQRAIGLGLGEAPVEPLDRRADARQDDACARLMPSPAAALGMSPSFAARRSRSTHLVIGPASAKELDPHPP